MSTPIARTMLALCLGGSACIFAQTATVATALNPALQVPKEMMATCASDQTGKTCPVIEYEGLTSWAYSFRDNRDAFAIVAYDPSGNIVKVRVKEGARFIHDITVDPQRQTVTFRGQENRQVVVPWAELRKDEAPLPPVPIYMWTAQLPHNSRIGAPGRPVAGAGVGSICRGRDDAGRLEAGFWDGTTCVGGFGRGKQNAEFLVTVMGDPLWYTAPGKPRPEEIGILPPYAVNAGDGGQPMILCSRSGYVGSAHEGKCVVGVTGTDERANATVLVGVVQQ